MRRIAARNPKQVTSTRDFGGRIRSLRQAKGWTLEDLAGAARIHVTYLSGVERGKRNPTLKVIIRIARALDVRLANFFTEATRGGAR